MSPAPAPAVAGGPIIHGKVFPFVFITVACGAISGFHALIGSGTTPKMIDKEGDCRFIGYGAMLMEGLVGITSLIAAGCLHPADYFAINLSPAAFHRLGMTPVDLVAMSRAVGEDLAGRTAGSVSLAVITFVLMLAVCAIFAEAAWRFATRRPPAAARLSA